jgi:hypothetical protein
MNTIKDNIKRILISEEEKNEINIIYERHGGGRTYTDEKQKTLPINYGMNNRYVQYATKTKKTPLDLAMQFSKLSDKDTKDLINIFKQNEPNFQTILNDAQKALVGNPYGIIIDKLIDIAYPKSNIRSHNTPDLSNLTSKNNIKIPLDPEKEKTLSVTQKEKEQQATQQRIQWKKSVGDVMGYQTQSPDIVLFQKTMGLVPDGKIGVNTWNKLKEVGLIKDTVTKQEIQNFLMKTRNTAPVGNQPLDQQKISTLNVPPINQGLKI